jgi:divalent metal cation (Fe/Co/Zn/Cd) transporter
MSDALTSIAVLAGLALVRVTGYRYFDPITALLIGGYIGWVAVSLLRNAAARLMDEQDLSDRKLLTDTLDAHVGPAGKTPRICGYHKLRHRHSGRFHWVDFHILVPANWTVEFAHAAAQEIEDRLDQILVKGEATAHVEPCTTPHCPNCRT